MTTARPNPREVEARLTRLEAAAAARPADPLRGWTAVRYQPSDTPGARPTVDRHPVAWIPADGQLVAHVLHPSGRSHPLPSAHPGEGWGLEPAGSPGLGEVRARQAIADHIAEAAQQAADQARQQLADQLAAMHAQDPPAGTQPKTVGEILAEAKTIAQPRADQPAYLHTKPVASVPLGDTHTPAVPTPAVPA